MRRILSRASGMPCILALFLAVTSCNDSPICPPTAPEPETLSYTIKTSYALDLQHFLQLEDGAWDWIWRLLTPAGSPVSGRACLHLVAGCGGWLLDPEPPLPDPYDHARNSLLLEPADREHWHSLQADWPPAQAPWLALPRLRVDSPHYADLLALLQALTAPRFLQVVTHWPRTPIPVRAGSAQSGSVDLTACLREAVDLWNAGEPDSLFRWDPEAGWGIRLIHFPGIIRQPPLAAQLVRRDAAGHPVRLHILVGDNYNHDYSRPYAIRGLVHELAHSLLLWGHSLDRNHILWGAAPPLMAAPAVDERRAARLLRLLPSGLDLNRYGRSTQLDTIR